MRRDRTHLAPQRLTGFDKADAILEYGLRLILRRGQDENVARLALGQLVPLEQRQEHSQRGRHARLASAATDDRPQLSHPLAGRRAITCDLAERRSLGVLKRQSERGLKNNQPQRPRRRIAERPAE